MEQMTQVYNSNINNKKEKRKTRGGEKLGRREREGGGWGELLRVLYKGYQMMH